MPNINVGGTIINFPDSGSSPDWSPAIIQFAQAVEAALVNFVGAFDVPSQSFIIDAYNPGSNVNVPNLTFPTANVRSAFIRYDVYRNTSTTTAVEAGDILVVYNPANPTGNKWDISQVKAGEGSIVFNITDAGQVQISTSTLGGINHSGAIRYLAQALPQ